MLINLKQRKQREFEDLESIDEILKVLGTEFINRKLYIRFSTEKTEILITEFNDDNTIICATDPSYTPGKTISIYGLSDKYLEIDLEVIEERGPGYYLCKIISSRRAVNGRRDLRFKVDPEKVVATNFKISMHTIDVTGFKMPTSIKVVLDQFHSTNSKLSDIVKVDILRSDDKDILLKEVKKTGKTLYIENAADEDSYNALTEDFLNINEIMGNELKSYFKINVQKGYKSIIIVPIIYITETESSIPFAYIQIISKTEHFGIEKVLELKDHSFKLVDRIRDANTQFIPVHQRVVDISRGGAKLRITDEILRKSILKSKGFIFDLVFKLQAPITIYGEIKSTYSDEAALYAGVDFAGNSSRKDEMKRFYATIKPMEAEYKAKLIQSLKTSKK